MLKIFALFLCISAAFGFTSHRKVIIFLRKMQVSIYTRIYFTLDMSSCPTIYGLLWRCVQKWSGSSLYSFVDINLCQRALDPKSNLYSRDREPNQIRPTPKNPSLQPPPWQSLLKLLEERKLCKQLRALLFATPLQRLGLRFHTTVRRGIAAHAR